MLASSATGEPLCFTSSEGELGDTQNRKKNKMFSLHTRARTRDGFKDDTEASVSGVCLCLWPHCSHSPHNEIIP